VERSALDRMLDQQTLML